MRRLGEEREEREREREERARRMAEEETQNLWRLQETVSLLPPQDMTKLRRSIKASARNLEAATG
eukprot:3938205-Rhodomonas_salina.3